MSGLTAFAVAFCATRAIQQAKTWAGPRVYCDVDDPVDVPEPVVCVYAGHGHIAVESHDLIEASSGLRLRFELFLPASFRVDGLQDGWLDTSRSTSLAFGGLWRQVETALQSSQGVWADLYRRFVLAYRFKTTDSGLYEVKTKDKTARIAARSVEFVVDVLSEPTYGAAPVGIWADLIAAMQDDSAEVAALAPIVAALIQGGDVLPDWKAAAAAIGLSPAQAPMQGFGAPMSLADGVVQDPDGNTEPLGG